MNAPTLKRPIGLDGVPAAETALSLVDGAAGRLIIAGQPVDALAGRTTFEELVARLWTLASGEACASVDLGPARVAAFARIDAILRAAEGLAPIDAMRIGLAAVREDSTAPALACVAAAPVIAAAVTRAAAGHAPIAPDPSLPHAGDYLRMLRGAPAQARETAAMDAYLVTVSDHGMNASTFAARVAASTRCGIIPAVTAGYCALVGPLHGGAPGPVLDMLDDIGARNNIESWLEEALTAGDRLMGFGHRIYRSRDPRADVLKSVVMGLSRDAGRLDFALRVEAAALAALKRAKPDRPLDTNVEFYTALLLEALDIPRAAFTPTFAVGRVAGWTAHAIEQERIGRLIRPDAVYTGAR